MRTRRNTDPLTMAPARDGPLASVAKPAGRFILHLLEMCAVMCVSGILFSLLIFGAATLLGYSNLPETAPELAVLIIALNLSVPMATWMRFRGMDWQPTLEMAGATLAVGMLLIVAYRLDLVTQARLIPIQTSLACPVMLAVMLPRFRLYSAAHTAHHAHA